MKTTPKSKPQQTQAERSANRQKAIDGARPSGIAERKLTKAQEDELWPTPEVWNQHREGEIPSMAERKYRGQRANEDKAAIVRRELRRVLAKIPSGSISDMARKARPKINLQGSGGIPLPTVRTLRRLIAEIQKEK